MYKVLQLFHEGNLC